MSRQDRADNKGSSQAQEPSRSSDKRRRRSFVVVCQVRREGFGRCDSCVDTNLNVHPCVPKKIIDTLTLSILKSVHTSISSIIFYKLCSVATLRNREPLLLKIHVRIIALTPDLQRVFFYSVIGFLYHSSTTELILSLILIKRSYPSSKASLLLRIQEIFISLVATVACKFR
jgi:hypothetical protein